MTDFRQLNEQFWVSPQLRAEDIPFAAERGITLIVNNRPEGESSDQVPGDVLAQMAAAAGIRWLDIPVTHSGFAEGQLDRLQEALEDQQGVVLAYCRSGTRSTYLWALTMARLGKERAEVARAAADAGYDLAPIAPLLASLGKGEPEA